MTAINKMLIVTNPGVDQANLFGRAANIAARTGCAVDIVAFSGDHGLGPDISNDDLQQQLELAVSGHFEFSDDVVTRVIDTDQIADWVIDHCENDKVDLVMKTGHRTEHFMYQPTDWQLIRGLHCALMFLAEKKWRASPVLLATLDIENKGKVQQEINRKVLEWTSYMNEGCELNGLNCIEINRALEELDMVERGQIEREKRDPLKQQMRDLANGVGIDDMQMWVSAGEPAKKIPSLANQVKADLVIMGSIGRKGIKGALLGNTAEKVLHNIRTDVLIVKPD